MSDQARIHNTEALRAFRPALVRFAEDAGAALVSTGSNAVAVLESLRRERLPHWTREVRLRSEQTVRANTKLIQQTAGSDPRPSVDARKAYELAKRRVQEAEHKREATLRAVRTLEKEIGHYRTAVQPMNGLVRADIPAAIASLDQSIAALDAYTAAERPSTPARSPNPSTAPKPEPPP